MQRLLLHATGILLLLASLPAHAESKSLGYVSDPLNVPLFGLAGQTRLSVELGQRGNGVLGYKNLKTEAQLGFSVPLVEASGLDNNLMWFSLGIGLDLFKG